MNATRRAVDGVLLLDKPSGITSHGAVQRVRRLFNAAKAGHTGTLDPLATGLLPVCLGEATKFSQLLLDSDKTYVASMRLDLTTRTGDLEGEVTARFAPDAGVLERVEAVLQEFVGELQQVPPMFSALKQGGRPLYELARAGMEVARSPRRVVIRRLTLLAKSPVEITVRVNCSKGTYIRVLAEDIGRRLGCGGCLSALRREAVGALQLEPGAVTFEHLDSLSMAAREALLLPADALVASLPRCDLDAARRRRLGQGQPVEGAEVALAGGLTRVYGPDRDFLGVAEVTAGGRIVPKRLVVGNTT